MPPSPSLTHVLKFDPSEARDAKGRWTEGSAASVPSETAPQPRTGSLPFSTGSRGSGSTPESRADALQELTRIKGEKVDLNEQLLDHATNDTMASPEAQAIIHRQRELSKQMFRLDADPGGMEEGIGKPGGPRDVAIVGAGPAGLAAAINGGMEELDTLLIDGNPIVGGQAKFSSRLENVGRAGGIPGKRLTGELHGEALRLGSDQRLGPGSKVTGLTFDPVTGMKTLTYADGTTSEPMRTVILAMGVAAKDIPFPGREASNITVGDGETMTNQGKGDHVVVVGGSNGAAQAALGAAKKAKSVTVVTRSGLNGMSASQARALQKNPKIKIIAGDEIASAQKNADGQLTFVTLKSGTVVPAKAMGLFLGGNPPTDWLPSHVTGPDGSVPLKDASGRIFTNKDYETPIPGVFAVGDVRAAGEHKIRSLGRVGASMGEGQVALANTFLFMQRWAKEHPPAAVQKADKADENDRYTGRAERRKQRLRVAGPKWDALLDAAYAVDEREHPYPEVDDDDMPPTPPTFRVVKADSELQICYGEVYAPNRPDAQGEYMTAGDIRKMAHEFLRSGKMGQIDVMHGNALITGASVVESFIADTKDARFLPESWVIGVHVPDATLWGSIKKGEINGFSMEALVTRHDMTVEIEIPPVVTGLTSKAEDQHQHTFFVAYDAKGVFKGGVTDEVNGHHHAIVAGTHTQDAAGHRHRFSSVDTLRILE